MLIKKVSNKIKDNHANNSIIFAKEERQNKNRFFNLFVLFQLIEL